MNHEDCKAAPRVMNHVLKCRLCEIYFCLSKLLFRFSLSSKAASMYLKTKVEERFSPLTLGRRGALCGVAQKDQLCQQVSSSYQ